MSARPEVRIDRLVLDLPGLDSAGADRLALLVARRLAGAAPIAADVAIPRLPVTVLAGDDLDAVARAIARAVLRTAE